MPYNPAAYQPGRAQSWPGFQGDRMTKTELTILNIIDRPVGLPDYQVLQPGERITLLVTADEKALWENCKHVNILNTADALPDSVRISGVSTPADDSGRMQQNDALGAAPVTRRAGRPRKTEPVNVGDNGRPEAAEQVLAGIHKQPGVESVQGSTDDLNDNWPDVPGRNQGQDEPKPDFKSLAAGDN